jgi:hypothetical protein
MGLLFRAFIPFSAGKLSCYWWLTFLSFTWKVLQDGGSHFIQGHMAPRGDPKPMIDSCWYTKTPFQFQRASSSRVPHKMTKTTIVNCFSTILPTSLRYRCISWENAPIHLLHADFYFRVCFQNTGFNTFFSSSF